MDISHYEAWTSQSIYCNGWFWGVPFTIMRSDRKMVKHISVRKFPRILMGGSAKWVSKSHPSVSWGMKENRKAGGRCHLALPSGTEHLSLASDPQIPGSPTFRLWHLKGSLPSVLHCSPPSDGSFWLLGCHTADFSVSQFPDVHCRIVNLFGSVCQCPNSVACTSIYRYTCIHVYHLYQYTYLYLNCWFLSNL